MDSISNQQLQVVIAQFDQALYSHEQWYKNLRQVLLCPASSKVSMDDSHTNCCFAKWYDSPQLAFLHDNPTFISLGNGHEKMHRRARHLIQRISDGLPILVSDWRTLDDSIDKIRTNIQALLAQFTEVMQNRDPLTEAKTSARLLVELCEQQAMVQRGEQVCMIAIIELDHFKRINDQYGHAAGDQVLVSTVHCVKSHLRSYDRIYRYGGEEFIICMPSTTVDQSRAVIERMRNTIADQNFDFGHAKVTTSFGASVLRGSRTVAESINCAGKAMHEAKAAGRNRVVFNI